LYLTLFKNHFVGPLARNRNWSRTHFSLKPLGSQRLAL